MTLLEAQVTSEAKANAFLGKIVTDWGATVGSALVVIGDKLGLYDALAKAGPLTSAGLAQRTDTNERYCREWLLAQAAGGYLEYDPASGRYTLPPEHAAVLGMVIGGFEMMNALTRSEPRIVEAFRNGGMSWGEHHHDVFEGCERFFRPGYERHLTSEWIPAMDGIEAKLQAGGWIADVGCGHGAAPARAGANGSVFGNGAPAMTIMSEHPDPARLRLRIVEADDRDAMRAFLGRLSQGTVQARNLQPSLRLVGPSADRELGRMLDRSPAERVVVVAVDDAEIRGVAECVSDQPGRADIGLVVEDAFRQRGIGRA